MNEQTQEVLGWHWLPAKSEDGKFYLNNVTPCPETEMKAGATHTVDGKIMLCARGLHASTRALDALRYAGSSFVARVRLDGKIVVGDDKMAASERAILWIVDADRLLREFACDVAEDSLNSLRERGIEPDARSWRAIEIARLWFNGMATDQ